MLPSLLRWLRRGWNAALVAVPLALAITLGTIEVLAIQTDLRLLLFPSLASIAYLLFTRPYGPHATWRGAVVAPSVGAGIGSLGTLVFRPGFLGVLVITFATMLAMRSLRVTTAPVLAIAILPLVFQVGEIVEFPASIFLATTMLFLLFKGWRRVLPPGLWTAFGAEAAQRNPEDVDIAGAASTPEHYGKTR
jgi:hypothetical protein